MENFEDYRIEIHINKNKHYLVDILKDFHNIHKIVNDVCPYCERNNIKTDKQKIELIKKITNKYFQ